MVSIVNDYCAFMIATLVERCSAHDFTALPQYSPEAISVMLNQSKDSFMNEFSVDPCALHQGFHLYKRFLVSRGFLLGYSLPFWKNFLGFLSGVFVPSG